MKIDKKIMELLYRSFDDDLSDRELAQLEAALAASEELRTQKTEIASMRKAVADSGAAGFGYMFAEGVMRRVEGECSGSNMVEREAAPAVFDSLMRAFRPVAIAGAVAVLGLMVYNIVDNRDLSFSAALGMPQSTLENTLESPLDSVLEELS
jgi:hypothetical protein